ncbi:polynucleotidyl transferase, ribonuclease H-like superfamily protein isoform X2 [Carex rostrata]
MKLVTSTALFQQVLKTGVTKHKFLGLDVGSKYVGLAVSDEQNKIAIPLRSENFHWRALWLVTPSRFKANQLQMPCKLSSSFKNFTKPTCLMVLVIHTGMKTTLQGVRNPFWSSLISIQWMQRLCWTNLLLSVYFSFISIT